MMAAVKVLTNPVLNFLNGGTSVRRMCDLLKIERGNFFAVS